MITTDNIDFDTFKLEIQANSAHNDGWTQQFYKDELKKVKARKKEPKIHPKSLKSRKIAQVCKRCECFPNSKIASGML